MPGLFDLLMQAGGKPDPYQQIAAGLGRAPGQPGSPQGPQPLAPPAPVPAGDGSDPAAGGPAAPPGGPGAAPAAPPQPQAYTSQPDFASMYLQYSQRQAANEMFNRGLAGMAASFARPWNRDAIRAQGQGLTGQDPGELFGNLMKLQGWQQGQQRLAGLQASIPGLVKAGMIPPEMVPMLQNDPSLIAGVVQAHQPEGMYRNWLLAHDDYVRKNSDPNDPASAAKADADFRAANPLSNALTPGGGDLPLTQLHLEANDWQSRHRGEPLPDWFSSIDALAAHKKQVGDLTTAQSQNSMTLGDLDQGLTKIGTDAAAIAKNKKLDSLLTKAQNIPGLLTAARKSGWAVSQLPGGWGLDQDELDLLHKVDDLTTYNTSTLKNANPHMGARLGTIDSQLGTLQQFDSGPENWKKNLSGLVDAVDSTSANAAGAAGQLQRVLDKNDSNLEMRVDPSYLPGGRNYLGEPKKMTDQQIADGKKELLDWEKEYPTPGEGHARYLRHLQLQGYSPPPGL